MRGDVVAYTSMVAANQLYWALVLVINYGHDDRRIREPQRRNSLAYPISRCYRHGFELAMK
jgi:hypothetical protein